jgi:hypothetical protein
MGRPATQRRRLAGQAGGGDGTPTTGQDKLATRARLVTLGAVEVAVWLKVCPTHQTHPTFRLARPALSQQPPATGGEVPRAARPWR